METFYFHSDSKKPNRTTVCGLYDGAVLRLGAARTSDKDRFCKELGRSLAYSRAFKTPLISYPGETSKGLAKRFVLRAKALSEIVRKDLNYLNNLYDLCQYERK